MNPNIIPKIVKDLYKKYSHFPDGRIDYSNKKTCAVMTIFVEFKGKVLIMKRSDKVSTYKGKWMTLAGYYDEKVPLRKKVLEEFREEIGLDYKIIKSFEVFTPIKIPDKKINKEWMIFTCKIVLKKRPKIKLDWEHTGYKWVKPDEVLKMDIVPSLAASMDKVYKA